MSQRYRRHVTDFFVSWMNYWWWISLTISSAYWLKMPRNTWFLNRIIYLNVICDNRYWHKLKFCWHEPQRTGREPAVVVVRESFDACKLERRSRNLWYPTAACNMQPQIGWFFVLELWKQFYLIHRSLFCLTWKPLTVAPLHLVRGRGGWGLHGPLFLIITLGVHVFGFGVCRMLVEVSFIHFGHFAVTLLSHLKQILGLADQLFNSLALELVSCQLCAV